MLRLVNRRKKDVKETYTVEEDPTPGTYGDYLLLKEVLRALDEDTVKFRRGFQDTEAFEQLVFNTKFLEGILKEYGELHCEYCGKQGLVIYRWNDRFLDRKKMATTDHILPVSLYPDLAKDISNLAVACDACNKKKATNLWERKFPYKN